MIDDVLAPPAPSGCQAPFVVFEIDRLLFLMEQALLFRRRRGHGRGWRAIRIPRVAYINPLPALLHRDGKILSGIEDTTGLVFHNIGPRHPTHVAGNAAVA